MIIVFGSISMDMSITVDALPKAGDICTVPSYDAVPGGRAGNQALTAARVGAKVALVGTVGEDGRGTRILNILRQQSVMTSGVSRSDAPTGCTIFLTDTQGTKTRIVITGANAHASSDQVPDEILNEKSFVIVQNELGTEENRKLLKRAKAQSATTLLNLIPDLTITQDIMESLDYLVLNALEAEKMAATMKLDISRDAARMAQALAQQGKLTCIITLGAEGSLAAMPDGAIIKVPAAEIDKVIDRSGAGDAYVGTLAACLHAAMDLETAMKHASIAGSLTCTRKGTHDAFPYIDDIKARLEMM